MIAAELEAEVLERLRSPHTEIRRTAAGELFELSHPALFQVALRMTGRRELADEAVQETFVRVLRAVAGFRGEAKLSTWIFRIAMREALRAADRSRRTHSELHDDLRCDRPGHAANLADAESAARILAAIARLPKTQRIVFSLAAVEELPQTEIAEILGVPVGTVYSRMNQARESLREALERAS